jgi:hypothetical protein
MKRLATQDKTRISKLIDNLAENVELAKTKSEVILEVYFDNDSYEEYEEHHENIIKIALLTYLKDYEDIEELTELQLTRFENYVNHAIFEQFDYEHLDNFINNYQSIIFNW